MTNSPRLPVLSIILALIMGIHVMVTTTGSDGPLTELQLAEIAVALALAIFGVQGLISVVIEGTELHPGRMPARLTGPLSAGIIVLSIILFGIALFLAYGIVNEWQIEAIGSLAGAGCIVLAILLVFYKEAFVGDEASFDDRQDGVPW